jgi:hypothetical protein
MLRMRITLVVVACLLSASATFAQTASDAFNAFRDSVLKKQFVLRDFSGETKVQAIWTGTAIELDAPRWRTFAALQVNSVKMHGQLIRLDCTRRVLAWNKSDQLAPYDVTDPIQISIDLRNADPVQALPHLRDELFYSSAADALSAVPALLKKLVPAHVPDAFKAKQSSSTSCDCSDSSTDACAGSTNTIGVVPPKLIHYHDPEFSDEARQRKLNGRVGAAFIVDASGHVADLWVTRPLGMGMSEQAADSVLSYVFQPATCHGRPITVPLATEVNFQIY